MKDKIDILVPEGWRLSNNLYVEMQPEELHQSIVCAISPNGAVQIEVGWFPENDPTGAFFAEMYVNGEKLWTFSDTSPAEIKKAIEFWTLGPKALVESLDDKKE